MTNFIINQSKQSLILTTSILGCAVGLGYYLTNYYKQSDEWKQENFYKKSIQTHIINKINENSNNDNNNNNNKVINIIITYSLNIPIDVVKRTAKYIYNNINNENLKVNLFSIEYSEIEHFNDLKEKSKFDAIIAIDESSNSSVNNQSSLSNSNLKKFNKISVLLKPSSPFLTFYYQKQQIQQSKIEESFIENEIVRWNSNNIFENKMFYELCGFNVESITDETLSKSSLCLVVSKSPDWLINSRDNLSL